MGNINGHERSVTAPWLRMRLAEPDTAQRICLIDATPRTDAPCLPYSRPLDVRALVMRSDGVPPASAFQAAVRNIGATSFDQVVIYDRDIPLASCVLWRLFRAFGHRDTAIVEGGYQAWCGAAGELASHYLQQEVGTWRAAEAPVDGELLAEIQLLLRSSHD